MSIFSRRNIARESLRIFLSKHQTDTDVLDLGCSGAPYKDFFPHRVGFDIEQREGVDVVGDAHALPFEDASFETIVCTEVLEHLHTPHQAVKEMYRVLKPGGKLILTTRFLFPIHGAPHDYYRYTRHGLEHLFQQWDQVDIVEETLGMKTFSVILFTYIRESTFRWGGFGKAVAFFFMYVFRSMPRLTKKEFGNRRSGRVIEESSILASGYYVVCKK